MIRALQIFAALLLIGIVAIVHQVAFAFFNSLSMEFGSGLIIGSVVTILAGLFLRWLDSPPRGSHPRSDQ